MLQDAYAWAAGAILPMHGPGLIEIGDGHSDRTRKAMRGQEARLIDPTGRSERGIVISTQQEAACWHVFGVVA